MKKRVFYIVALALVLTTVFVGCTPSGGNEEWEAKLQEKNLIIAALEEQLNAEEIPEPTGNLMTTALAAVELLKTQDMAGLAAFVHPQEGLRFTAYPYVDVDDDLVFAAQDLAALVGDTQVYTWGIYDGIGEPINLTFNDYYYKFIYDVDFANPHFIGNSMSFAMGNTIDNSDEAYPGSQYVEFYFTGFDPWFEGFDWRSLRLVFTQQSGTWYLVGVIHGQWTI